MTKEVYNLWPELNWIEGEDLRNKTAKTWELALERSVLTPADLNRIPFTLLVGPDLKVTFPGIGALITLFFPPFPAPLLIRSQAPCQIVLRLVYLQPKQQCIPRK